MFIENHAEETACNINGLALENVDNICVKIFRAYNFIIKSIARTFIIFQALLKTM